MQFQDYLLTLPNVDHLLGLDVLDSAGNLVQHIPAIEGKLGSLRVYNSLAEKFCATLNTQSAKQGLEWFAEHVTDAKRTVGKHPNIDLLLRVVEQDLTLALKPIVK
ncbi:hypothetical protein EV693_10666 [Nicoletella semolina]|uniref:DUF2322 family protein n=1 Tax=Nicoletella semolina TaxID=271160 RepID=A0A4R2N8S4_9PAST|nr:DUF2322 family protein [Nicoletella semolina]MDH2924490.1 hypothetical protein [Nicoletella semolina]TCP17382.1 hypothetical protein EV693_10666 [Nicoletella semolina]